MAIIIYEHACVGFRVFGRWVWVFFFVFFGMLWMSVWDRFGWLGYRLGMVMGVCVGSFPGRSSIVWDVFGKCLGMFLYSRNMVVVEGPGRSGRCYITLL